MIRTRVINMARSHDRREAIARRLAELEIPFEFFPAADGSALTREQRELYSSRAAFAQIGREMHPNEIGCILSHIGIWRELVDTDEDQVLVIEDDMRLDPDFPSLVKSLAWVPADARVVNFSWDMAVPREMTAITATRSICRFDKPVMRTGSYIIRKEGARELLRNAFPIRMPVDSLMGDERNVGTIYGITPRPVNWDEALPSATWVESTMDSFSASSRRSIKGRILRIFNRLFG
jgi:glycosyl transferase family 25